MGTVTSKALQPFKAVDIAAQLCTVVDTVRRLSLMLHILFGATQWLVLQSQHLHSPPPEDGSGVDAHTGSHFLG